MIKLHAIVNVGPNDEILCFCPFEEYLRGRCECRDKYNASEAMLTVEFIKTNPEVSPVTKQIQKTTKEIHKQSIAIKKGITNLEKAIKNSRFKM